MKREVVAAALSAIVPGVGQFYNRQWAKGAGFLIAVMVVSGAIRRRELFEAPVGRNLIVALLVLGIALWSVADAYRGAKAKS